MPTEHRFQNVHNRLEHLKALKRESVLNCVSMVQTIQKHVHGVEGLVEIVEREEFDFLHSSVHELPRPLALFVRLNDILSVLLNEQSVTERKRLIELNVCCHFESIEVKAERSNKSRFDKLICVVGG